MAYAQTNIGTLVEAYVKETGEVVIRWERAQWLLKPDEWERIQEKVNGTIAYRATPKAKA